MSKVKYEETYGIWNGGTEEGIRLFPMCPKCNEPTYSEARCPFCREELEYE